MKKPPINLTVIPPGTKTFTLFAPTDKAFASLSSEDLTKIIADRSLARELVFRHLIPGTLYTNGMRYYQIKDSLLTDRQLTISKQSGKGKNCNRFYWVENERLSIFSKQSVKGWGFNTLSFFISLDFKQRPTYSNLKNLKTQNLIIRIMCGTVYHNESMRKLVKVQSQRFEMKMRRKKVKRRLRRNKRKCQNIAYGFGKMPNFHT